MRVDAAGMSGVPVGPAIPEAPLVMDPGMNARAADFIPPKLPEIGLLVGPAENVPLGECVAPAENVGPTEHVAPPQLTSEEPRMGDGDSAPRTIDSKAPFIWAPQPAGDSTGCTTRCSFPPGFTAAPWSIAT